MKIYRIKIDDFMYVKAIVFETSPFSIGMIPTIDIVEAGWYEEDKAKKEIERIDKLRANHYKHYTDKDWKDFSNYDICINSDLLGVEKSADMICNMVKGK